MMSGGPARPALLRLAQLAPKDRGGGVRSYPLATKAIGATSFLSGITEFDPHCGVPLHFHNCDESVTVIAGEAVATIDGVAYALSCGDTTFVPAGMVHFFRNSSDTSTLRILWVYGSVDADRTVVATGENRRIDEELESG